MLLLQGFENGDKTNWTAVQPKNKKLQGDRKPLGLQLENKLV